MKRKRWTAPLSNGDGTSVTVIRLQRTQDREWTDNSPGFSGRLRGRLAGTPCPLLASQAFRPRGRNTHPTQPRLSLPICLRIADDIELHASPLMGCTSASQVAPLQGSSDAGGEYLLELR